MDTKNKKSLVICGCVVLLLFIGASALRCSAVNASRHQEQVEQQTQATEQANQAGAEENLSEQDKAKALLTDDQRAKIGSYDEKTQTFVAMLEANVWTNDGGMDSLVFKENTFTDTNTKREQKTTAYVITALDESSSAREGEKIETTIAAVETAAGTNLITFEKHTVAQVNEPIYYLRSALFSSPTSSYARTEAGTTFEVVGLNDDVDVILGGTTGELKTMMQDYCARQLPVVRAVTWTNTAVIDWTTQQVMLNFEADNGAKSKLTATYSMESHTYTVDAQGTVN